MKTILLLIVLTTFFLSCKQYPQPIEPDDYSYYKFYDDSIGIKLNIYDVNNSIMINNMLTLTEMLGIKYWDRMRARGVRFLDADVDSSFDKQLRNIWNKQNE